jgi:hypothetical protein
MNQIYDYFARFGLCKQEDCKEPIQERNAQYDYTDGNLLITEICKSGHRVESKEDYGIQITRE